MYLCGALAVLATVSVVAATPENLHPLSDEYIALINQKQSTWIAGKNFDVSEWERVKKISSGVVPSRFPIRGVIINPHDESEDVPDFFDSREAWPNCDSLFQIRDQSTCSSSWAFAAVEAMSDRICIHTNQTKQVYVSAENLISCCDECGSGCEGGTMDYPWEYWRTTGIVSGGLYNSSQGCQDYSMEPCEHHVDEGPRPQCNSLIFDTPACKKVCDDPSVRYTDTLTFGQEFRGFYNSPKQVQLEILKNGPVETGFTVYADFLNYKSGVYHRVSDRLVGYHAAKIIGWGVENAHPYWLLANSWNTDWGENGYFKFVRGIDECTIEYRVFATLPVPILG